MEDTSFSHLKNVSPISIITKKCVCHSCREPTAENGILNGWIKIDSEGWNKTFIPVSRIFGNEDDILIFSRNVRKQVVS